jgi:hypothetical protein
MGKIVIRNSKFLSSSARSGAALLKTGQTISYITGDDGDIKAGRTIDFFTLGTNNPFGDPNRFTALDGSQTYADNIVIDWSTYGGAVVLGYHWDAILRTWENAVAWGFALNVSGYTGWRLTNYRELANIVNLDTGGVISYSPFNLAANIGIWVSSTLPNDAALAYRLTTSNGNLAGFFKTNSIRSIACRNFTVTGTTLT